MFDSAANRLCIFDFQKEIILTRILRRLISEG
jgi:hypothetical protein